MVFGLSVLGNYYVDFRITGEPLRLVPEADLCLILLLTWAGYLAWNRWPSPVARGFVLVLAVACCAPAYPYLRKPRHPFTRTSEYKHLKEFQIADWIDQNRPGTRSFVTGTLRFWWNAWHDGAQIGGGSEQGVHNMTITPFFWRMVISPEPHLDIAWLQAFGVDQVMVNDKTSALPIADFEHPYKYRGVLPVLWEDGSGNWIYAIPRKHGGLARVVDAARYAVLQPPAHGDDEERVRAYVDVLEKSTPVHAETSWLGADTLEIQAETAAGQALAVQVAYDPYWRAREAGQSYPVDRDAFGQIRIQVPPGKHRIQMQFDTPLENIVGRWVTVGFLALVSTLLLKRQ
jgi:hypothetical protein